MSTMAGIPPAIPEYRSDWFVNREKEIELVVKKAQALSLGDSVRERTIVFWGYKGTGRTWLLKRLEETLSQIPGVQAHYLDLADWGGKAAGYAVEAIVEDISRHVAGCLGRPTTGKVPQGALADRADCLMADIQSLLSQHVFALLLDHVYESSWDLLELLEEWVLASVAVKPHMLLVMAGRGRAYPWKKPELRLYAEDHHLTPFEQDFTKQQLEKQKPDAVPRAPEIHEMSQGYPLGNYLLAARPTVIEAMQETVDGLLDRVPAEERSWLEALCVLRTFDEERIPVLLAVYREDQSILGWPYKEVRQMRDRLLQTRMALWKEQSGGWIVDEAIRPVLERYLQRTKPETWRRLHCAAYRLYKDWAQQYPDEKQRWQYEAGYHAQCLRDAGQNPDQCL